MCQFRIRRARQNSATETTLLQRCIKPRKKEYRRVHLWLDEPRRFRPLFPGPFVIPRRRYQTPSKFPSIAKTWLFMRCFNLCVKGRCLPFGNGPFVPFRNEPPPRRVCGKRIIQKIGDVHRLRRLNIITHIAFGALQNGQRPMIGSPCFFAQNKTSAHINDQLCV